ncbi:hypothetical protein [Nocardiopsis sp. LOL_012]|uniref:hypothetical protein n=1 Tax=Nocardiopsis sp. LOL_012 TaxID=3345409 RepID=UPI003A8B8DD8
MRAAASRDQERSAGISDSQSVKGADTVPQSSRGCDAAKRINGRKRFIVTDIAKDRDRAKTTLLSLYLATPVRFVFADAGFAGALVAWTARMLSTTLHIVRKDPAQVGFAVISRSGGWWNGPWRD